MFKLRDYQEGAVNAAKSWMSKTIEPAVMELATGAGKSIIMDAIQLAMGGRADPSFIRDGQQQCDIILSFDIQNNLILSNSFPTEVDSGRNLVVGDGDFRDASSHDYFLDQYSPAVDSASDLGISTDRFGTDRPLGNGFDMGAVESH